MSSVVISREICDWQRFKNRRQVSSYTGLCPGEYSSGTKRVTGSVTKHGNGRLRAALVEYSSGTKRVYFLPCPMARFRGRVFGARLRDNQPGPPELIGNVMYWEAVSTADGHLLPP